MLSHFTTDIKWLRKEELPLHSSYKELSIELDKKCGKETWMIQGYLEIFLTLAPEILYLIFATREEILVKVLMLNKAIRENYYHKASKFQALLPISIREIRTALESENAIISIQKSYTDVKIATYSAYNP